MEKSLLAVILATLICFALQVLPIITVPITKPSEHLHLSKFNNFVFGVYGLCEINSGECSKSAIGYPSTKSKFLVSLDDSVNSVGIQLPSGTTYTVSKLLVVHVISFTVTGFLLILELILLTLDHYNKIIKVLNGKEQDIEQRRNEEHQQPQQNDNDDNDNDDNDNDEQHRDIEPMLNGDSHQHDDVDNPHKKRKTRSSFNLSPCLDLLLSLTLFAFLSSLLGFLVDLLLFVDSLTWIGWIQLFPLFCFAFVSTFICFLKRNLSTRKYLEDSHYYENDDMRTRKNAIISRWSDDASDDGFYVYTKGFSSNLNHDKTDQNSNWIQVNDDDISIYSHENIEMDDLHGASIHVDISIYSHENIEMDDLHGASIHVDNTIETRSYASDNNRAIGNT